MCCIKILRLLSLPLYMYTHIFKFRQKLFTVFEHSQFLTSIHESTVVKIYTQIQRHFTTPFLVKKNGKKRRRLITLIQVPKKYSIYSHKRYTHLCGNNLCLNFTIQCVRKWLILYMKLHSYYLPFSNKQKIINNVFKLTSQKSLFYVNMHLIRYIRQLIENMRIERDWF